MSLSVLNVEKRLFIGMSQLIKRLARFVENSIAQAVIGYIPNEI
jgi:hypothetical protein